MPAWSVAMPCSSTPSTSWSQISTNGEGQPRSATTRGPVKSPVIWLSVLSPSTVPGRSTSWRSRGWVSR